MARETGKQRSQRIQIDYFRRRGGLQTFRTVCIAIGLVGAGLYAAFVLAWGGGSQVSTGQIARPHAAFQNDCQLCHEDFTPMDSEAIQLDLTMVGVKREASIGRLEAACQACHQVGDHYRNAMTSSFRLQDQNCGACHSDHQGLGHDLSAVANQKCAVCHAKLADTCKAAPTIKPDVASFTKASHGDFASLMTDDIGTIKFDHHQHLMPGQVDDGQKGAFTIEMLDAALRPRYRKTGQSDSDAVQLDCASCHTYAGNPDDLARYPERSLIADHELGRYMAPVSYRQHCAACHAMNPGIATADTTPIPHAVAWSQVDLLIAADIVGVRSTGQARGAGDDTQSTPQPGEGIGSRIDRDEAISAKLVAARKQIESQCLKCHDDASISDTAITAALDGTAAPMIPPRWLMHGLYDHAAHRDIDCRYCHQAAYPVAGSPPRPAIDHTIVMISGIESCDGCHRSATTPTPASLANPSVANMLRGQSTWAADDCTMCHRYHTSGAPANQTESANLNESAISDLGNEASVHADIHADLRDAISAVSAGATP
ncbi:Doubled CXXCH motif (Paired_CXXCH_1) [Rubripirellula lacrimiformis]|uniref:Doubled CXXCH motif (Paired_CXXCH_1) n=1 Tax=Rubripirellula lacrimiformis TaxID=1930273 RepID=A0A517NAN3_9BACT|nr:cytochrome c3 family protein [Rubripirellula lacrimiformis]QDT04193.1 Doubled CXXCH motif (Paired_CXXCH_1) [Rubripirellula lacrimiformis]